MPKDTTTRRFITMYPDTDYRLLRLMELYRRATDGRRITIDRLLNLIADDVEPLACRRAGVSLEEMRGMRVRNPYRTDRARMPHRRERMIGSQTGPPLVNVYRRGRRFSARQTAKTTATLLGE